MNDNPLVQALQQRMKSNSSMVPQDLLDFILTHYDLVPKGEGEGEEENDNSDIPMVQTQESHRP